jgi:hypothetical protein
LKEIRKFELHLYLGSENERYFVEHFLIWPGLFATVSSLDGSGQRFETKILFLFKNSPSNNVVVFCHNVQNYFSQQASAV